MYQAVTSTIHATSVVSTNISRRLGVAADLDRFSVGAVDQYIPKTLAEYQQYRRYMHDILCLGLIEAKLYTDESLTLSKLGIASSDKHLMSLKPDLYSIEMEVLRVCEVSLTFNYERMSEEKNDKYNELFSYIEQNSHYLVQYSPLVVDLTDAEWEDNLVKIPNTHMNLLRRFVSNLVVIHSTPEGDSFRTASNLNIEINFPFSYDKDWWSKRLVDELGAQDGQDMINKLIEGYGELDLGSSEVQDYLDKITDGILTMKRLERPFPHPEPLTPKEFILEWEEFRNKPENTAKLPVVLQLGAPTLTEEITTPSKEIIWTTIRSSSMYGGYIDHIKQSNTTQGEFCESGIIKLFLTEDELKSEMLQGPGRKRYIRQNNMKLERKAPTHIGVKENHINLVLELIDIFNNMPDPLDFLLPIHLPDMEICGYNLQRAISKSFEILGSNGFDFLLQFYSRITEEIILNSMKRRRSREYVLGHSGFEGIYFLIAPGPQLRTESNVEFIKIISSVEPISHILVREWHVMGNHWESDWLSVDTDRLKHWARARHRVNLSILGSAEKLISPDMELIKCVKEEVNQGNYGLMSLIYLEDKSATSTTIQTTRYVMMKSLGDKRLKGLMSKFPTRVSSTIQSLVLQRTIDFSKQVCGRNVNEYIRQLNVKRDEDAGNLDETTTGVVGRVPRIFTSGDYVPIKYTFNEIYWCMMYNKDRQNKVQDSMKILSKIAKEELKFREELSNRNDIDKILHTFGVHTTEEDLNHISSTKPESHYFSLLAVSIGVALQDVHSENFAPRTSWLSQKKLHDILNKNLSEYATFKASVKSIQDQIPLDDADAIKTIGRRTKCIELIHEIVQSENLYKACEIAMSFSGVNSVNYKTVIQIFKKNQIGGVREILILYIKARVLINLTEEISRLLSKSDKRETLTKGKDKRLMMRGDYEELSSQFPEGTPLLFIKNSYDMSTWCQKFIPTIFLPIYNHRSSKLQGMIELCRFVMLTHCLKEIEFPQKLVEQWIKHKDIKHEEAHLQFYKEKFLSDGIPKMTNCSNMGQGILHYNSTVLALSCQSLRDELFRICLKKLSRPPSIMWKTRVGSDDKGDTIAMDLSRDDCVFQAQLFEQCAAVSERLHAMELSVKSASGNIIYEFNSAYMANLEVQSPTIKFTLAATDMIGTDSCTQFVNESYSRIRQLRENGGTSFLCLVAHTYNRHHFNSIFRTGPGMVNDPCKLFELPRENIPYDFGNYPLYDADVQDMIGPEFHNYMVFKDRKTPQDILRMLYTNSIKINGDNTILPDDDEGLFKKDTFNISQGLVRQLENMKSRLNLSRESIEEYLIKNPFLIVRGPLSAEETSIVVASKLYTRGAAVSLRRTSPVIYLGRLTAFESARAWTMFTTDESGQERKIKLTFSEYIQELRRLNQGNEYDIRRYMSLIFPQHNSFEVVRSYIKVFGMKRQTMKLFSQSIRTWILNNYNYNFYYSLKDILETSFGISNKASRDDVMEMRKMIPFSITSYQDFIENCRLSGVKPLDLFYYMTKIYKTNVQKKAQVFAYGPSTSSLNLTLANIKKYNHMAGSVMEIDFEVDQEILENAMTPSVEFDRLKLAFNILMLEIQGSLTSDITYPSILTEFQLGNSTLHEICETILRNYTSISKLDSQMRKICVMLASKIFSKSEFMETLVKWGQLCYTYIKKQKKDQHGNWVGDLIVLVNYSNECYLFNQSSGYWFVETNRVNNLDDFHYSLSRVCKIMQVDLENVFTTTSIKPGDIYLKNSRMYYIRTNMKNMRKLNITYNTRFGFRRIKDLTNFKIEYENLKDGSTQISIKEQHRGKIVVSHYPGHYYPVEIPKNLVMNSQLFVNGLRITKLFKQRQWFLNGRLFPFNAKEAVDVLQNHIKPDLMKNIAIDSRSRIQTYMDEYEDFGAPVIYERIQDPNVMLYDDTQLNIDVGRQTRIMESTENIMDMFQKASEELMKTDWAEDYTKEYDWENAQADEEVLGFVRALGENKIKKSRKDFYTLTNLRMNVSFMNRIMDLFFKSNSIRSEPPKNLPDYALHVMSVMDQEDHNYQLYNNLLKYIVGRMEALTGKSSESLYGTLNSLYKTRRHYNTIDRLTRFLNVNSPDLYDLLGGFGEDQVSESDEEY